MAYLDKLLAESEQVRLVAHRHIISLILNTALYVLGAIAALVLAVLAWQYVPSVGGWVALLPIVVALVAIGISAYRFMRWRSEQYVVTNYRIIQVEGILNKHTFDSSIEKVNDVQMTQTIFGRVFNYGNVHIITGSDLGVNNLGGLADPFAFKRELMKSKLEMVDSDRAPRAPVSTRDSAPTAAAFAGTSSNAPQSSTELLAALVDLRDSGVITAEEYERRKQQLLQRT